MANQLTCLLDKFSGQPNGIADVRDEDGWDDTQSRVVREYLEDCGDAIRQTLAVLLSDSDALTFDGLVIEREDCRDTSWRARHWYRVALAGDRNSPPDAPPDAPPDKTL